MKNTDFLIFLCEKWHFSDFFYPKNDILAIFLSIFREQIPSIAHKYSKYSERADLHNLTAAGNII